MHVALMKPVTVYARVLQPIFTVQSMEDVKRAGICGNGMCETGERCDPSSKSAVHKANHTCCLKDCPYVSLTCPIPLTGAHPHKACGGNGICLDASGQCSCFLGKFPVSHLHAQMHVTCTYNSGLIVSLEADVLLCVVI